MIWDIIMPIVTAIYYIIMTVAYALLIAAYVVAIGGLGVMCYCIMDYAIAQHEIILGLLACLFWISYFIGGFAVSGIAINTVINVIRKINS